MNNKFLANLIIAVIASSIFGFGVVFVGWILGMDMTYWMIFFAIIVLRIDDIASWVYRMLAKRYLGDKAWLKI